MKQAVESSEDKERGEIKQEIIHSLDNIRKTEVFDPDFLNNLVLVCFGENKTYKFQGQKIIEARKEDFSMQDFMQGRRTDFTGINPKREFEKFDTSSLEDKQFLPFIFFEGKLTYDEFVAHEIAHNLFDKQYIKDVDQYEERCGITDVSEEYKMKVKKMIAPLIKKHYPNIDIEKFAFNRQQIAEIFTMMYEREFCQKANDNSEMHRRVKENVQKFTDSPEEALIEFNKKHHRNCTMDDFYQENHTLSLITAPLLEETYPEWEERKNLFWR